MKKAVLNSLDLLYSLRCLKKLHLGKRLPPRPGNELIEFTFESKLAEIRKRRSDGPSLGTTVKKGNGGLLFGRRRILINGKAVLEKKGDWALMESRKSGRRYYFNIETCHNQWAEPEEWRTLSKGSVSSLAPSASASTPKFQMTIKKAPNKVISSVTCSATTLCSLSEEEKKDYSLLSYRRSRSRSSSSSRQSISSRRSSSPPAHPPPVHTLPNFYDTPTWISDYNFPATLSRCKFPKESEVITELTTNRYKKRNLHPLPSFHTPASILPLALSTCLSPRQLQKELFLSELRTSSNRYRLLTDKLGLLVYRIPDDLWERYFTRFSVELFPGLNLECRPHGITESGQPVYMRTGKVANIRPFPEDIVRCHAVVQAFEVDTCALVYANKNYVIQRDDGQWNVDLDECKKFLKFNGF
nr:uncharacterized protein LOC121127009 [Lepeophtheirus salmonis]